MTNEPVAMPILGLRGTVTATGWQPPDAMTEPEWKAVGETLGRAERGVQWWLGDWWVFGEAKYGERKAAVDEADYQTFRDLGWVAASFEMSRRRDSLPFNHHREVAPLSEDTADDLLDWCEEPIAETGKPRTIRELRAKIAQLKAKAIAAQPAIIPDGKFETIVIDPPWDMEKIVRLVRPNQEGFDYPTMSEEQLAQFGVPDLAADDCHLFCWTTHKHLPMALRLLEPWGFHYVNLMVWHKPGGFQPIGLPQCNCEFIVYARRGAPKFRDTTDFFCCFEAPRREHSRKPNRLYDTIRRVTSGPRVDVFSREPRDGFDQAGNEVAKFGAVA